MEDNFDELKKDPEVSKRAEDSIREYKKKIQRMANKTADMQKGLITFNYLSVMLQNPAAYKVSADDSKQYKDSQRAVLLNEAIQFAEELTDRVNINLSASITDMLNNA